MLKQLLVTLGGIALSVAFTSPAQADIIQKPFVYEIEEEPSWDALMDFLEARLR